MRHYAIDVPAERHHPSSNESGTLRAKAPEPHRLSCALDTPRMYRCHAVTQPTSQTGKHLVIGRNFHDQKLAKRLVSILPNNSIWLIYRQTVNCLWVATCGT